MQTILSVSKHLERSPGASGGRDRAMMRAGICLAVVLSFIACFGGAEAPILSRHDLKQKVEECRRDSALSWWIISEENSFYVIEIRRPLSRERYRIDKNFVELSPDARLPVNLKLTELDLTVE
jgi:hypothetical protein